MTLSLGLVFAIALLAPGIAAFLGLVARPAGGVHPAQPQPGSLLALAVIGLSALAAHMAGALAYGANQLAVENGLTLVCTRHATDPYAILLASRSGGAGLGTVELAVALLWTGTLALFTFLAARRLSNTPPVRRALFGWLAPRLAELENEDAGQPVIVARVLTTVAHDGVVLGYHGYVEAIALDADRELASISLTGVHRFSLLLDPSGATASVERELGRARRGPAWALAGRNRHLDVHGIAQGAQPAAASEREFLGRLHLPKSQIANVIIEVENLPPP